MGDAKLYVAEIDGEGHLAWVWVVRSTSRSARPFSPETDRFDPNEPAEFFGARPMAMMSWLGASQQQTIEHGAANKE